MRRKRWFNQWSFWVVCLGGIGVAAGIVYLQKRYPTGSLMGPGNSQESSQSGKPSANSADGKNAQHSKSVFTKGSKHAKKADSDFPREQEVALSSEEVEQKNDERSLAGIGGNSSETFNRNANSCEAFENPGLGPEHATVTDAQWSKVVSHFYAAKGALLKWLNNHAKEVSESTAQLMKNQLEKLKLDRPPYADEMDLTWRGTVTWQLDDSSEPRIRVGSGFIKTALNSPERAKFELTRLVAQTWAPCELKRLGAHFAWEGLLACFRFSDQHACDAGTYSEAGWIVSSVLASKVAPMKCWIPALEERDAQKCVAEIPLATPATSAKNEIWTEAKR